MKQREIQAKIVYYGPGRGGKTTNLEWLYQRFRSRIKSEMVSIKTHGDRTLFFDFLPIEVGMLGGYQVRIQLYTVPGQVKYNATRELVLKGVDGVVFVADMMAVQRENNRISLANLAENLQTHHKDILTIPLVLQYNKCDLKERGIPLTPLQTLQQDLNSDQKIPHFVASAMRGDNVVQTFKQIVSLTMASLRKAVS